jgi:hypothetical protein
MDEKKNPKASKVTIGKFTYSTNSPKITLVDRADGSQQWMVKKSRFVTMAYKPGNSSRSYCHVNDVVTDVDTGSLVFLRDGDTTYQRVEFMRSAGAPLESVYCLTNRIKNVRGSHYHILDCRIVRTISGTYCMRSECKELSKTFYPPDSFALSGEVHETGNGYCLKKHCVLVAVPGAREIGEAYFHWDSLELNPSSIGVVLRKKDDLQRFMKVLDTVSEIRAVYQLSDVPMIIHGMLPSLKKLVAEVGGQFLHRAIDGYSIIAVGEGMEAVADIHRAIMIRTMATADLQRKRLNFPDPVCNHSISIDASETRKLLPGGTVRQDHRVKLSASSSFGLVGHRYTYGVEFECAVGYLDDQDISGCHLAEVGDRSIGANEYVTGVLHGDSGLEDVAKVCSLLQRKTFVDSRCGLHVHIGGMSVSDMTSVAAIRLGTLVEESMFMMQPPCRTPLTKQTASIVTKTPDGRWGGDFTKISDESYADLLSVFVFGERIPKESWDGIEQGKWPASRYKWLNLCNCHGRSRFRTIEFRVFAGTHDFLSVLQYIRLSMAFVWMLENKRDVVMKSKKLTIRDVASYAYEGMPVIKNDLLHFIDQRTEQFKRDIYQLKTS